jgi:SAM-dependent methyltransferase
MQPKPRHLGPEYGAQFADASVVAAYQHRPPYPAETFSILSELLHSAERSVLDAGCGRGELARGLLALAERLEVDAVDPSAAMLAAGRALPGGDDPRLRWIAGAIEDAPLDPPYGLIVAGESAHWFDWPRAFPRLRAALAPGGVLALVGRATAPNVWDAELLALIQRYSTNLEYQPYDLLAELVARGLFAQHGRRATALSSFQQPLSAYIESVHSRNGFSRERMAPDAARAFDTAARELLVAHGVGELVELRVGATVTWGDPAPDRNV